MRVYDSLIMRNKSGKNPQIKSKNKFYFQYVFIPYDRLSQQGFGLRRVEIMALTSVSRCMCVCLRDACGVEVDEG